ncbi:MAG: hypothetical protein IPF54_26775 [Draconibacterium sp.]|nr:hypothetical protein [Draconibacterium sp.]
MWKKYFKVIKIIPGEVVVPVYGKLDFSKDNISVEVCRKLFESDFPYLAITAEGRDFLYGTTATNKPLIKTKTVRSRNG